MTGAGAGCRDRHSHTGAWSRIELPTNIREVAECPERAPSRTFSQCETSRMFVGSSTARCRPQPAWTPPTTDASRGPRPRWPATPTTPWSATAPGARSTAEVGRSTTRNFFLLFYYFPPDCSRDEVPLLGPDSGEHGLLGPGGARHPQLPPAAGRGHRLRGVLQGRGEPRPHAGQ